MRNRIIAGNWKMFTTVEEGTKLAEKIAESLKGTTLTNKKVVLIPPFLHILSVKEAVEGADRIEIGAQNCYFEKEGAFTGEISPRMLAKAGISYVIIGHSERRQYFGEDNAMLGKKVVAALEEGLTPIYCCGETFQQREKNEHFSVVETQVLEALVNINSSQAANIVIAYEPVWAIGTGKTASKEEAQEIHAHIRSILAKKFDKATAEKMPILYGGSVKPGNAAELFGMEDIDGGLVGGASLNADDFLAIIKSA